MKPTLELFTAIAREHLCIETLEERYSDRLDFHDVSVVGVKDALQAAYQAGVSATAQSSGESGVLREMREALVRAEFLMRRVHEGDHHALENLPSAAKQARTALARMPCSVADEPRAVHKQLTSSGLFHTPGVFRALQNDYRIKGKTRRRAIQILSEGYGLPCEEAEGLLSGAIAIAIDEAAGTIAYAIAPRL